MAALIRDERCFVLASFIFFLLMKTEQATSGTSAATYKVMKPHYMDQFGSEETLAYQRLSFG